MTALLWTILVTGVAGATGWLLAKTPPFLEPTSAASRAARDRDRLVHYARWFTHVRWAAIALAVILAGCADALRWLPPEQVGWLLGMTAVLALANAAFARLHEAGRHGPGVLATQLYLDIGFLTLMLHLAGGIENPLYLLPVFHVLLAATVLPRRQSMVLAGTAAAVCTGAVWAEWAGLIPHVTLQVFPHGEHGKVHEAYDAQFVAAHTTLRALMMLLTAHFVSRLAGQSRAHEERLARAADEARESRELLEQALNSGGIGLRVLDGTLGVVLANEQWHRWLDTPPGEQELEMVRRTLADSGARSTEVSGSPSGAGPAGTYLVTTAPLHDREGRTDRVVEVARDVGPERELQARMLSASKLAAVGEVAGKLAHEINNPTAIINAKARLLFSDRRSEMSDKVAGEVQRIIDLSDRVASIARGLLAYGRPSGAPRRLVDLRAPACRALSHVREHASRRGVRVVEAMPEEPCLVEASEGEMEQVFMNLLLNGLDAMPQGGLLTASLTWGAGTGRSQTTVTASISDTGVGVPEDVRERIFEPFFTTKRDGKGSGLGLSVCEGIVRSHGGSIALEPNEPGGTRFVVRLPAAMTKTGGNP